MRLKESAASGLYEEFIKFCPKLHKVTCSCDFDKECMTGKCIIKWILKNKRVEDVDK